LDEIHKSGMPLYHGSPRRLKILRPRNLHGDPDVAEVIFATPFREFALAYAGRKWGDRDLEQSAVAGRPPVTLREMRPGAFQAIFSGKRGFVYQVPSTPFQRAAKRKCMAEVASFEPVVPLKVEVVEDVLQAIQADPRVKLVSYDPQAPETLAAVRRSIRRMRRMEDKGVGYLRWRLKGAPPEIVKLFRQELWSMCGWVYLPI